MTVRRRARVRIVARPVPGRSKARFAAPDPPVMPQPVAPLPGPMAARAPAVARDLRLARSGRPPWSGIPPRGMRPLRPPGERQPQSRRIALRCRSGTHARLLVLLDGKRPGYRGAGTGTSNRR